MWDPLGRVSLHWQGNLSENDFMSSYFIKHVVLKKNSKGSTLNNSDFKVGCDIKILHQTLVSNYESFKCVNDSDDSDIKIALISVEYTATYIFS